jgi:predicted ester cyclase
VVATGTHTGAPFPPGIPASGKSMTWKEVHIFRCADGRIAEHWGVFDLLGILQQLGAIPA